MARAIVRDTFGEILETGKSTAQQAGKLPGQVIKTAGQQISGKQPSLQISQGGESKKSALRPEMKPEEGIKELLGKPLPQEKMVQLKQKDVLERNKGLDEVRSKLGVEKIKRYQEMQQRITQEQKKKEEVPESEQAKTGYRTLEEKAKWLEAQRKKEEEEKGKEQGPLLPESAEKMPGLDRILKPKKGTKEMGKKVIG